MSRINIKKRGKVYQYCFEAVKVNGKRKQITKSGFKTKNAAYVAGEKAYEEYINGGCVTQAYMSYGDYLDYWIENYCKEFLAHRTVEEYSVIANKYLKPGLGHFRLNEITSHQLNMYLIEICKRYNYSYGYFRNFVKTIKCSFRVATDIFGFIRYNPSLTIQLPPLNNVKKN
ncbi:MAG: Arm DNA-binding domain-containing protein [Bacilli bacterium]|nr:Arm DNA-binding domain-containing protein [Bacilli bacterium]MBP3635747.1 Arm DNA-binding domain-containing protein [Bacilli bacterium]